MGFGKFGSEIFNSEGKIVYVVTKKFKFWKWKMVFTIRKNRTFLSELISQNTKKTVYSIALGEAAYQIKIQYKKRISVFKNELKIAEFDQSFSDEKHQDSIKLQLLNTEDLEICFLLFSCLKIGEVEKSSKAILTSQKQLEKNEEPWS
jgi:hypothetical protein